MKKAKKAKRRPAPSKPRCLTLWEMLRKHGVGLYAAQMICNDVAINGVTLPDLSKADIGSFLKKEVGGND